MQTATDSRSDSNRQCRVPGHIGVAGLALLSLCCAIGTTGLAAQQLEEVVVIARRVEASLQQVPVAVSVWSEKALVDANIYRLENLNRVSPSFYIDASNNKVSNSPIQVRGVGTVGVNPGFEGAVGVYVDGIYRSRPGMALQSFNDIGSVELLRGPQGTLFGKNTSAGAILFTSVVPSDAFGARLELELGDYDHRRARFSAEGRIVDGLAGRLSLLSQERDGFHENPVSGNDQGNLDSQGVKGQLVWDPDDSLSIKLILSYDKSDERCCYGDTDRWQRSTVQDDLANLVLALRPNFPDIRPFDGPYYEGSVDDREVVINWEGDDETENLAAVVDVHWELGRDTLLRSLTGLSSFDNEQLGHDADFGPVDLLGNYQQTHDFNSFSQEFNLSGSGDRLDYIVGLFYSHEELEHRLALDSGSDLRTLYALAFPGLPVEISEGPDRINPLARGADTLFETEEDVYAAYGHLTWRFTNQWVGLFGVRYTLVERTLDRTNLVGGGTHEGFGDFLFRNNGPGWVALPSTGPDVVGRDRDDDEVTYNLGLQYFMSPDAQAYLTFTTGFKAGGFSLNNTSGGGFWVSEDSQLADLSRPHPVHGVSGMYQSVLEPADNRLEYEDETVESWELGVKADFWGRRGRVNLALFRSDFEDIQINQLVPTPPQFVTYNAEEVVTEGLELEATFAFTEGLTGVFAVTRLWEANFGDNLSNPLANDPVTGFESGRLPHAPDWAGHAMLSYRSAPWKGLSLFGNFNLFYKGDHTQNPGPIDNIDGAVNPEDEYILLGLELGLEDAEGRWRASVRCANCADELYSNDFYGQPFHDQIAGNRVMTRPGDPRTWVAAFSYNWR